MDRADRIGYWVSGVAHAGLLGFAVLGGALFRPQPLEAIRMAEVSTMSEAEFQALASAADGRAQVAPVAETTAAQPRPPAEDVASGAPEAQSRPEPAVNVAELTRPTGRPEARPDLSDVESQPRPVAVATLAPQPDQPDAADEAGALPADAVRPDPVREAAQPQAPVDPQTSADAPIDAPRPHGRPDGLSAAAQARREAAEAARQRELVLARQAEEAAAAEAAAERRAADAARRAAAERAQEERREAESQREAEAARKAAEVKERERRLAAAEAAETAEAEARAREERAAEKRAADKAAAERAAAAKAAAAKAAEEKAAEEKAAAEKAEAERRAAEAKAEKEAEERAAAKAAKEKAAAEKKAAEEAAAAKAKEKAEAERRAAREAEKKAALAEAEKKEQGSGGAGGGGAAASGPPLSQGEKDGFRVAVEACWNRGSLSTEASRTTVSVQFSMAPGGTVEKGSLRMVGHKGGSDTAAKQAYEAARRAILMCERGGYQLPAEKYDRWKDIIIDFNPSGNATIK